MAQIIIKGGGGAGVTSDDVLETGVGTLASQVLEGTRTLTADSDDNIVYGSLLKKNVREVAGGTLKDYDGTVS